MAKGTMNLVKLTINGQALEAEVGTSILQAGRSADIYIPTLCHHPDLPPAKGSKAAAWIYRGDQRIENALPEKQGGGCGLCLVEIAGEPEPVASCTTAVEPGMVVVTESDPIKAKRRENLIPILARHPHACLVCAQQEGCSRTQCSSNVPGGERCCPLFGHCELQMVADYVLVPAVTPKWIPTYFPVCKDGPFFERDYNLCIGCTRCVRACRDLSGIEAVGFVFDPGGRVQVGTLDRTLKESGCKFCMACVEVCPTGALIDKSVLRGEREIGIDTPGYLRLNTAHNPSPPGKWFAFNAENISNVPDAEGVFRLFDEDRNVLVIKGTPNLRQNLLRSLQECRTATLFEFVEDRMYTKRESECIQRHLQAHGKMPGSGDEDLDDLF